MSIYCNKNNNKNNNNNNNSNNSNNDYGYVYCMINISMKNLCKIGFVNIKNKTSHDRAKELSSSTGCPTPFEVIFDIKVKNPSKYEKIIHNKLNNVRQNNKREFFICNPEEIEKYFKIKNLITCNKDIIDFHPNYFTIYNNLIKIDTINMYNISNNNVTIKSAEYTTLKY